MTLSACGTTGSIVLDSKCQTISSSEITDEQIVRLQKGDDKDKQLAQRILANDEVLTKDCMPLDKVDGSVIDNTGGEVTPANGSITAAKLASDAVTTVKILNNNVTKAKLEQVATMKVLGNTTGSTANVAEVTVYDEDNMASNSATALATQQSIKAYVDATLAAGALTKSFTSSDQTMTLAGGLTLAHGMAVVPKVVNLQAVCQVADGNYAINDVVYTVGGTDTANVGVSVYADATNVYCRVGSTSFANMLNKTTGASFVPTLASWKLRVRAFA